MRLCAHVCMCLCKQVCACARVRLCACARVRACAYARMRLCSNACKCVRVFVLRACVCACECVLASGACAPNKPMYVYMVLNMHDETGLAEVRVIQFCGDPSFLHDVLPRGGIQTPSATRVSHRVAAVYNFLYTQLLQIACLHAIVVLQNSEL